MASTAATVLAAAGAGALLARRVLRSRSRDRPALRVHHPARRGRRPQHRRSLRRPGLSRAARRAGDRRRERDELDGTFALHPALVEAGQAVRGRPGLFVHAVASPYRDRSHFDGQNVLETGGTAPYR